jgi:hypothetical protein
MARIHRVSALLSVLALASAAPSGVQAARPTSTCGLEVIIDGRAATEYSAPGARYIEALKGKNYAIRLHNPFDVRVAVALSVDGLNTIDARHTTASAGRKWVVGPHETITISGWQTSMAQARRFYFTSEERSYAGQLGQPDNIGVISAVFFREREPVRVVPLTLDQAGGETRRDAPKAAPAPSGAAERGAPGTSAQAESAAAGRDEFAATGIGEHSDHPIVMVHLDLEARPVTSIDIHYEYREQLVRLGVLPDIPTLADPAARRQNAHGFDKGFCPDIR